MSDELIAAFPFLAGAEPRVIELLRDRAVEVNLPGGQVVCAEGTHSTSMPLVLSGSVRVFKTGETGREITLYRLEPGEGCILTATCIINHSPFPACAIAETNVSAYAIPADTFRDWVSNIELWRDYVFQLLARRLGTIIAVVEEVAFRRMDIRLIEYLARTTARLGSNSISTTHEAVAAELGSSREVISRLLKDLEGAGVVGLARGSIAITDADRLQRLVDRSVT